MNEPIKIPMRKNDILILKTNLMLKPDVISAIQRNIAEQASTGVVIIPNGFSYEIINRSQIKDEIIPSGKEWK